MPSVARWPAIAAALAALSFGSLAASADETPAPAAPAPVALDATHFVVVRGDRIVVYEVDPKKGYNLRVLNSALIDESGNVLGQFRPEGRPAVTPPASTSPTRPAPTPAPAPAPPAAPEPAAPTEPQHTYYSASTQMPARAVSDARRGVGPAASKTMLARRP
jgi:hypothetical protein